MAWCSAKHKSEKFKGKYETSQQVAIKKKRLMHGWDLFQGYGYFP